MTLSIRGLGFLRCLESRRFGEAASLGDIPLFLMFYCIPKVTLGVRGLTLASGGVCFLVSEFRKFAKVCRPRWLTVLLPASSTASDPRTCFEPPRPGGRRHRGGSPIISIQSFGDMCNYTSVLHFQPVLQTNSLSEPQLNGRLMTLVFSSD